MKSSGGAKTNDISGNSNESAVTGALCKIAGGITSFSEKIERIPGKMPERIAIAIYFIGHFLMMLVHEPWFDEALAWLIARESSLHEILFVAPRYEGHPSLWHLVLAPFAKAGASYELSLNLISLLFSGIAVIIFIFKSPFKRLIRLLIPFTYFIFYQYSIISRPYSMMMLAFVLAALTYKERDKKPGCFVLSLCFLCSTSAYGIVIAGGICIAWILSIFKDGLLKKGKIFWLAGILAYAIFIIVRIVPAEDAYAIISRNPEEQTSIFMRLVYTFFGIVGDSFFTDTYSRTDTLKTTALPITGLIVSVVVGTLIIGVIIYFSKKKKSLLEFLIPYVMLSVFMAVVYLYNTHIGIMFMFISFWIWVLKERPHRTAQKENGRPKVGENIQILNCLFKIVIVLSGALLIYWNVSSCVCDISYDYGCGREEAMFLKNYGLEKNRILPEWTELINTGSDKETAGRNTVSLLMSKYGINIAPYLDKEYPLNSPEITGLSYVYTHRFTDSDKAATTLEEIRNQGKPEVLLGLPELEAVYHDSNINIADYSKVYDRRASVIYKGVPGPDTSVIYVRNDIVKEKNIPVIE